MWEWLSSPRTLSPDALPLEELNARIQTPVMWLLGKTQAGKSSIVRGLTGDERAKIGDLFRPCTRTAALYDFPDAKAPLLRFLDTRGLGEANYDPTEDIAQFAHQAHLLMVVVRTMDLAQDTVLHALRAIHSRRPDWPILIVLTSLHEGYAPQDTHLLPYPYHKWPLPSATPRELAAAIHYQRQQFANFNASFVAIDFTQPEDDFSPQNYGLTALTKAIEDLLPSAGFAITTSAKGSVAQTILRHALLAGAAGAVPLPVVDVPLVIAVQSNLARELAQLHHQSFDTQTLKELAGAVGAGLLMQLGRRQLLKFIPAYGSAVSAVLTAASTYALGQVLATYFSAIKSGDAPNLQQLQNQYREQFKVAKNLLTQYFRRQK